MESMPDTCELNGKELSNGIIATDVSTSKQGNIQSPVESQETGRIELGSGTDKSTNCEIKSKHRLMRIKDYLDLSLNATVTASNLGDKDIRFILTKQDDTLTKTLNECEDKLIELCNSELFADLVSTDL